MQTEIIYYTITDQGAFYYDGKILPVLGYDLSTAHYKPPVLTEPAEIERRLEELRPAAYYRHVKVADKETLQRIAQEKRAGLRIIDAYPLAQIAIIVKETNEGTSTSSHAAHVAQLAQDYEKGAIDQTRFLNGLKTLAMEINDVISKKDYRAQTRQSWHMLFFFCELIALQLPEEDDSQDFHNL